MRGYREIGLLYLDLYNISNQLLIVFFCLFVCGHVSKCGSGSGNWQVIICCELFPIFDWNASLNNGVGISKLTTVKEFLGIPTIFSS